MKKPVAYLAALAAAASSTACGLAMMAPVLVEGQTFPYERVPELRRSMTPIEVEAVLGTPLSDVSRGQSRVWVYDERRQRRECRPFVLGMTLGPRRTDRHTLELSFGSGRLERAIYRTQTRDGSTQRELISPGSR